jgi:hypothetical protein
MSVPKSPHTLQRHLTQKFNIGPINWRRWTIILLGCNLAGILVLVFIAFSSLKPPAAVNHNNLLPSNDIQIAEISNAANALFSKYLTFNAMQLPEYEARLLEGMTLEYAKAFKAIWEKSEMTKTIKERKAKVSVVMDLPKFKGMDLSGRYFLEVTGRIVTQSDLTPISKQERAFKGTLVMIREGKQFKLADMVWENIREK